MKLEEQVLNVEQIQHLRELGVEVKDTAFSWVKKPRDRYGHLKEKSEWKVKMNPYFAEYLECAKIIPTLTLQEILELLPNHLVVDGLYYELIVNMNESNIYYIEYGATKILKAYAFMGKKLKAVYKMLRWVAENGYLDKD